MHNGTLVSTKHRPQCDLIVTRLDSIAMEINSVIDRDQTGVQNLIAALNKNVARGDELSALMRRVNLLPDVTFWSTLLSC